jgi:hypothetical protein
VLDGNVTGFPGRFTARHGADEFEPARPPDCLLPLPRDMALVGPRHVAAGVSAVRDQKRGMNCAGHFCGSISGFGPQFWTTLWPTKANSINNLGE